MCDFLANRLIFVVYVVVGVFDLARSIFILSFRSLTQSISFFFLDADGCDSSAIESKGIPLISWQDRLDCLVWKKTCKDWKEIFGTSVLDRPHFITCVIILLIFNIITYYETIWFSRGNLFIFWFNNITWCIIITSIM